MVHNIKNKNSQMLSHMIEISVKAKSVTAEHNINTIKPWGTPKNI